MQKNSIFIIIVVIILVIVGVLIYYAMQTPPTSNLDNNNLNNNETVVKTFTVTAKNFSFEPAEIKVSLGDRVKIIFNNTEGFHDFVIDEFNVKANQAQAPSTQEVEFIADKTGTFEFYCSVGTHRQMGMVGNLIVE
ncbi:MAG: cupredoxin domain-containing protein [Candidatus Staskawiczbacteria bacterium]|nr:cupredoxin domain-containing protein [Candidatus Staskawiczbacteria bacterium]